MGRVSVCLCCERQPKAALPESGLPATRVFDFPGRWRYGLAVSDERFPSGPWVGFYTYTPANKHRMELSLTFAGGRLRGEGLDDVGPFTVKGGYDAAAGECYWTKTYLGAHSVYYRGYREGKGIWGRWEISTLTHGGFHIWPLGENPGAAASETDAEAAVDAIADPGAGPVTQPQHDAGVTG
jgi:hypothetical protein